MPLLIAILGSVNIVLLVLVLSAYHDRIIVFGSISAMDFATISLMSATLVVAAIGVIVAVVTFVGFREIKAASIKAAREVASKTATEVATTTARAVAQAVATRTVLQAEPSETSPAEAEEIKNKAG